MMAEDFQRFRPELWVHSGRHQPPQHPNPVPFHDVAMLKTEMDLRHQKQQQQQQRQKQRKESLRRPRSGAGLDNPFNFNNSNNSPKDSFVSMPWEELLPKRIEQLHHQALQSVHDNHANLGRASPSNSSASGGPASSGGVPSAGSQPPRSSWFAWRDSKKKNQDKDTVLNQSRRGPAGPHHEEHWFLREKGSPSPSSRLMEPISMPPALGPAGQGRDGGRGPGRGRQEHHHHQQQQLRSSSSSGSGISNDRSSSFSMILKDKFQKHPNMYLPGEGETEGGTPEDSGRVVRNGRQVPGVAAGTRHPAAAATSGGTRVAVVRNHSSRSDGSRKVNGGGHGGRLLMVDSHHHSETDDTLIHNMSEGSYEKDRMSIGSGSGKGVKPILN